MSGNVAMRSSDIALLLVSLLLSAGITGIVKAYAARVNLVDVPNQRSSHAVATARGGGLSIVLVFFGVLLVYMLGDSISERAALAFMLGGGLVAAIGFADDHRHIPAGWRLLVQVLAAALTVSLLGGLPPISFGNEMVEFGRAGDLLAVTFMVWFTNAFNFMDGIDGIAASEVICIAGGASILSILSGSGAVAPLWGALAAASLGFLAWNWPPARIFMGDVGSAFLGFTLFGVALYASNVDTLSLWSWLILAGVFIVDAAVTLATRILRRDDWLSAHRSHAYQKASTRFESHRHVTIGVIAINVFWLIPIAYAASVMPQYGWWLTVTAWLPLVVSCLWFGAGRPVD